MSASHVLVSPFVRERGVSVAFRSDTRTMRPSARRPARVAKMLALAHHVHAAIATGQFVDQADVARSLGFTRARLTQLLDLVLLAPDVQEAVFALEAVDGTEPLSERSLRPLTRSTTWADQRAIWAELRRTSDENA